ncbi:Imm6 family immunity protein [Paenibacillus sp. FSL R7-0337]|uniref:Imm6 family immunity protein n=1 Tax=Paenibacillus sp. FSL R7-0337 TaxID=1926588 RepID=UPI0015C3BAA3|nr:Imm6 family immunity protein [Paenibacillus sp. FSL R7-0337]
MKEWEYTELTGCKVNDWSILPINKKIIFYLGLSEFIVQSFSDNNFFEDARNALDICWRWLETKIPAGDEIYALLDDGTEFGGLFIKMQMDEHEENEARWDCIVDAVSFVNKQAYILEGARYLPAPIENVDEDLIIHFLDRFHSINPENKNIVADFFGYILNTDIYTKEDMVTYFNK